MQDRILDGLARIEGWSTFFSEGVWGSRYTDPGSSAVLEIVIAADGPRFLRTNIVGISTWPDFWAGIDCIREVMRGARTTEGSVSVQTDTAIP